MEHKCLSPWKGALAGGLLVFVWSSLFRMFLPYHDPMPASSTAPASMAAGLTLKMVGAFFWTWILGKIPGLTSRDAALYGLFFGLCVGVLGPMPGWEFPLRFSLLHLVDAAVAWTAASVVIARWCQATACARPS